MLRAFLLLALALAPGCTLLYGGEHHAGSSDMSPTSCSCDHPPEASCLDGSTLESYASGGTCAESSCTYAHWNTTCQDGCVNGACVGDDPCAHVSCATAPAPACSDATTLVTYGAGTCVAGGCQFTSTKTACASGCTNGACTGEPCAGVACNTPPAAVCTGTNAVSFAAIGVCENGSCVYAMSQVACDNGCATGACIADCDPYSCQPPANTCDDASTLRSYTYNGCNGADCAWAATTSTCAYGCANGKCKPNPCQGVSCYAPAHGVPMCSQGNCSFGCASGYTLCGGNSCLTSCSVSATFAFPATGDTLLGSPDGSSEGALGTRTISSLPSATSLTSTWQIDDDLANGCTLGFDVYLNATKLGSVTAIGNSMTPTLSLSYTFAAIAGPTYTLEYRPTTNLMAGCGAVLVVPDVSNVTLH